MDGWIFSSKTSSTKYSVDVTLVIFTFLKIILRSIRVNFCGPRDFFVEHISSQQDWGGFAIKNAILIDYFLKQSQSLGVFIIKIVLQISTLLLPCGMDSLRCYRLEVFVAKIVSDLSELQLL